MQLHYLYGKKRDRLESGMILHYLYGTKHNDGYGGRDIRRDLLGVSTCTRSKLAPLLCQAIVTGKKDTIGLFSSRMSPGMFSWVSYISRNRFAARHGKWLLVLDADSTAAIIAVCHTLKRAGLTYYVIKSSATGAWIVTDFSGSYGEVMHKARQIPGVDQTWLSLVPFYFRYHIKDIGYPIFPDEIDLQTDAALSWVKAAKNHFNSPEVHNVYEITQTQNQLADGDLMASAADPDYEL